MMRRSSRHGLMIDQISEAGEFVSQGLPQGPGRDAGAALPASDGACSDPHSYGQLLVGEARTGQGFTKG